LDREIGYFATGDDLQAILNLSPLGSKSRNKSFRVTLPREYAEVEGGGNEKRRKLTVALIFILYMYLHLVIILEYEFGTGYSYVSGYKK